jgi:hypothetical protein
VDKDAAFCFVCYLFKDSCKFAGGDAFVDGGFQNWNMKVRINRNAGKIDSAHSEAEEKYNMFMRTFHGHDETKASNNAANFRELLAWLAGNFEEVNKVVLENAPQNGQIIDHKIQK